MVVRLAASAAVVVLLVVAAAAATGLLEFSYLGSQTVTQTSTITTTLTTTASQTLHNVTFYEGPEGCLSFVYGVQFGNSTKTDPPNLTLGDVENGKYNYSLGFKLTSIVFSVPSGVYKFALYPTWELAVPSPYGSGTNAYDGIITVTNSNITINATSYSMCA